jgi:hypothetical protein
MLTTPLKRRAGHGSPNVAIRSMPHTKSTDRYRNSGLSPNVNNASRQPAATPARAIASSAAAACVKPDRSSQAASANATLHSSRRPLPTRLGYDSTLAYLAAMCRSVFEKTGLLPHVNPGTMSADEIGLLRGVSVSQGIMLESASERLCRKGGPHFGSPDKAPAARIETIRLAGEARVPFTSGILIGIGETRRERIEALLALRDLHDRYGHIQEIIVQNFRAKPSTRMANAPEPLRRAANVRLPECEEVRIPSREVNRLTC